MRPRHAARASSVVASLLWLCAAVTFLLIQVDRWRDPAGGLPHGPWLVLAAVTGTSLVIASWALADPRPRASIGFALVLAFWLLPVAAGFGVTPPWAKALLLALPPLLVAALTEVGTGLRTGSAKHVRLRRGAWLAAGSATVVLLLGYDPFGDPSCSRTCLSIDVPLSDQVSTVHVMTVVGVLVAAATILGLGATFTRPATWSVRAAALSLLGIGLGLATLALNPRPNAQNRETFDELTCVLLLLPAAVVLTEVSLATYRRRGVERLAQQLTNGSALTGVEFAVGVPHRWVDAEGRRSPVAYGAATEVLADDRGPVVRWTTGAPSTRSSVELAAALHPATWLALDNARLAASTRARLLELRSSQGRIVAASDAERLRIGRDLHDQTQQRLVGASLHLRLAAARADPATSALLLDVEGRLKPVLGSLRQVSHGPFPDVLSDEGLAAALTDWAGDVRLATVTCPVDLGRFPAAVERAAYATVMAAAAPPTGSVAVSVGDGDALLLVVTRCAPEPYDLTAVSDRVGAAGGTLTERAGRDGWTTIEVVLPCGL